MLPINSTLFGQPLPILAYSFSSKGFPELVHQFNRYLPLLPSAYLVSLYDYKYYLIHEKLLNATDERIRIWDSGGYETGHFDDFSTVKPASPGELNWNEELYVETANSIPWNGKDILVNFDDPSRNLPISDQLHKALSLFNNIKGDYQTDILIHVQSPSNPKEVAKEILPYINRIQILGFTEKEIAPTWIDGVKFIYELREELNRNEEGNHLLFHIFGCLDPKTVIYFALAGANIFDGLTWLRYVFHKNMTLYKREFEYLLAPSDVLHFDMRDSSIAHNIRELQTLHSNLAYSIATADTEVFKEDQLIFREIVATLKGEE